MLETLKSARTRTVLLNATLFILFGFAWTSDRWPEFATASLLAACALVAVEIALLFKFSRRDGHDAADKSKLVEAAKTWEPADVRTVLPITSPNDEALRDALYSEIFQSQSQALRALQRHRALVLHEAHHKHLTDYLLRWTTAHSREARYKFLVAVKEIDRHQPQLAELEKWRLVVQGDQAFNIAAGAFEIEHFHGKTNIRVLDTSRVTVETGKRGVSLPDALRGLVPVPATYQ